MTENPANKPDTKDVLYSVVVPCYNENSNVLRELFKRLNSEAHQWDGEYEIIVVDDGSSDETWKALEMLHEKDPRWKLVRLSRNFGHQSAISAGLSLTNGEAVMVMDADLQDPPEVLSRFIEKWREGSDVVYAIRAERREARWKRLGYRVFYRVLNKLSRTPIPLDSGDFCLMDRRIVNLITQMPESNRFIRGLRAWVGFTQTGIKYERDERYGGEPKYNLRRLCQLAIDGLLSFSILPLRVVTVTGLGVSLVAFVGVLFTFAQRVFAETFSRLGLGPVPGFATIVISVLFIGGVQLVSLGIIGEYVGRVYDEVKGRPLWIIRETRGMAN